MHLALLTSNMHCQPYVALVSLCFLGTARGIKLSTILRYVVGRGKAIETAVTQCVRHGGAAKCKFDFKNLKLDIDQSIAITFKKKGRRIVCTRALTQISENWYGICDDDAHEANFVAVEDAQGERRLYGSLKVGKEICQIAPSVDGEDEIVCRPTSEFKEGDSNRRALGVLASEETASEHNYTFGYTPSPASKEKTNYLRGRSIRRNLFDNAGSIVDIMVVWTAEAECGYSNLLKGCPLTSTTESKMRGLIELAVAETNTAYDLSGINMQLRLVHAYRDQEYIEPASGDAFSTMLNSLRAQTDGSLDTVHAKRALYGADAVHMIVGKEYLADISISRSQCSDSITSTTNLQPIRTAVGTLLPDIQKAITCFPYQHLDVQQVTTRLRTNWRTT
jgi:hypothetical protein